MTANPRVAPNRMSGLRLRARRALLAPLGAVCVVVACDRPAGIVSVAQTPGRWVIRNVNVFPGDATAVVPARDVWIEGDRILRVEAAGSTTGTPDDMEIDGRGKTLLPGLIDVHTHTTGLVNATWDLGLPNPAANLEKYLYAGITTVFDLGGAPGQLASLREKLRAGELTGPDMFFSGPHVGPKDGHPAAVVGLLIPWPFDWLVRRQMSFEVADIDDVETAVQKLLDVKADLVKITIDELPLGVPRLAPALAARAVELAHARGLLAVAHIGRVEDALAAIGAGVDALVHGAYREPLDVTSATLIAQAGVPMAPTIGVFHASDRLFHEGPEAWTPLEVDLIPPDVRDALSARPDEELPAAMAGWNEVNHAARETRFANLGVMRAAGITLLVGSDSVISGWQAGASLHREMQHLVRGGYAPTEVLRAATSTNARAFRLTDRGEIAAGKRADLLLVDGDPTQDIRRVSEIAMVVRAGQRIQRHPPRY